MAKKIESLKKNMKLAIGIIFFLLLSCGENLETYQRREAETRKFFEASISEKQRKLIKSFFEGKIPFESQLKEIHGGFYCLWKTREVDIFPHSAINKMFLQEGYNITCNKDSMEFIVISETKSHEVGTYTNGGSASKLETIISVIDIKNETACVINKIMGGDPPATIHRKRNDDFGSIGSFFGDKDIFNYLKSKIRKEP